MSAPKTAACRTSEPAKLPPEIFAGAVLVAAEVELEWLTVTPPTFPAAG